MYAKFTLLVSFVLMMLVFAADADDGSSVITTNNADYLSHGDGYPAPGRRDRSVPLCPARESSPRILWQCFRSSTTWIRESASSPVQSGPVQFDLSGNEPAYLVINGESRPYDPYYVPANSFWILGRSSWTQYIKCPLNARFSMLALSRAVL